MYSTGVDDEARVRGLDDVLYNTKRLLMHAHGVPGTPGAQGGPLPTSPTWLELSVEGLNSFGPEAVSMMSRGMVHDIACPNQLFDRWLPLDQQGTTRPEPTVLPGGHTTTRVGNGFILGTVAPPPADDSERRLTPEMLECQVSPLVRTSPTPDHRTTIPPSSLTIEPHHRSPPLNRASSLGRGQEGRGHALGCARFAAL